MKMNDDGDGFIIGQQVNFVKSLKVLLAEQREAWPRQIHASLSSVRHRHLIIITNRRPGKVKCH